MTLQAAVRAALAQHPQLGVAVAELQAGEAAVLQAGRPPNPVLAIEQEDLRAGSRTSTVQLSQTLELGGKRAARVGLAQRGRELAALELATRRAELRAAATQAFFDALAAQERSKAAEAALAIAGSAADAARRRVAAGKVAPTEETRAGLAQAAARIELRQAEAERMAARRALAAAMGQADAALPRLAGDLDALPLAPSAADIAARLGDAPALRRARLELQRADAGHTLARALAVPDLTVGLGARRDVQLGHTQAVLSVSVPLPLFDRQQGGQLEALRRRDAAAAGVLAEELRLRSELLQLADRLQARRDEAEALRGELLPAAQAVFEAARTGFELGKFGLLDLLDAQRGLLQLRGQYLAAVAQAHRLAAEIERQLGAVDEQA